MTDQPAPTTPLDPLPSTVEPTPFIRQRPVRIIIYAFLVLFVVSLIAFRFVPGWLDPDFSKHIESHRVMVGMAREQVLQAWGGPYNITVSYTKDGIRREEWVYEDWESTSVIKHRYLYFEEGVLVGGWYNTIDPSTKSPAPAQKFHDDKAMKDLGY